MKKFVLAALAGLALTSGAFADDSNTNTVGTFHNLSKETVCAVVYVNHSASKPQKVSPGQAITIKLDGKGSKHFAIVAQNYRKGKCEEVILTPTPIGCLNSPETSVVVGIKLKNDEEKHLTLICHSSVR